MISDRFSHEHKKNQSIQLIQAIHAKENQPAFENGDSLFTGVQNRLASTSRK